MLKILIVDHECEERSSLAELCGQHDDVQIVGEVESGVAALHAADDLCPDVMLVDVKLPDMSGFDLLCAAHRQKEPVSVIVKGNADEAAAAFAAGALDYLLKPIDTARLRQSLARARQRCHSGHENSASYSNNLRVLVGERQRRLYPLEVEKIDYIEAHGNYVTIRSGACDYIRRDSIKRLSACLGDWGFVRIERSLLLNVRAVVYAQLANHGTFAFTLSSGTCVHSSPSYRDAILDVIPLVRRKERGILARSAGK